MRYIIDVTQLIHWPGNLTGIPRVMDELAIRFLNDTSRETHFVTWVKEANAMCEIDFAKTRSLRGKHIAYKLINQDAAANSDIQSQPSSTNPSERQIGPFVKNSIKKVIVKSRFDRTPLYKKLLENKKLLESSLYKKYNPSKDDVFFIPWGEWWDQNWLTLLANYHARGVRLYPISHDILPMVVPHFSGNSASLENFVSQIFPLSTKVLAVSQSSKADLTEWMKSKSLAIPTIEVFRLGEDFTFKTTPLKDRDVESRYGIKKDNYLVYVSTIEPRKNHLLLYYTYKLAASRGISLPHLVIIGRVGHDMEAILGMIRNDPQVNTSISIENNVDDDDLNWLYQHSRFAVTSSFYEGWGMSVLESIARGKPVVCSNTSSLLEMPDDCVIRFNPSSTDECLAALQEMLEPSTLKKYRNNTKKYKVHSWDASYNQVIAILDGESI
ncbi:glycosyltransferase family 4 protein [Candidatus Saccharibacteria bacterium TM7i]|nr:glycosyltransferase family 4 protein [Candidatus Saccharibacteria bacterium TM7i]